jgi:uncharacterized protein
MGAMREAANEFLSHHRIAVTGVSRNPKGHGADYVYQRLRDRGTRCSRSTPTRMR